MADIDPTLSGNLEWDILPRSFATDIDMETIQREILATRETWTEDERTTVTEIAILLSGTRSLKLVGKKRPASAVALAEGISKHLPADQLFAWRQQIPHKLTTAWNAAWLDGQDIFDVDPSQLPTNALTDGQKEELKNKNSPLAVAE